MWNLDRHIMSDNHNCWDSRISCRPSRPHTILLWLLQLISRVTVGDCVGAACRAGSTPVRCLCWTSTVQGMAFVAASGICFICTSCWTTLSVEWPLIRHWCTTVLRSVPPTCTVTGTQSIRFMRQCSRER